MIKSNEDVVTKILSVQEILHAGNSKLRKHSSINPSYNLGEYLKNPKPEPSRFGIRYVFVK